jgi:hypothetical protein
MCGHTTNLKSETTRVWARRLCTHVSSTIFQLVTADSWTYDAGASHLVVPGASRRFAGVAPVLVPTITTKSAAVACSKTSAAAGCKQTNARRHTCASAHGVSAPGRHNNDATAADSCTVCHAAAARVTLAVTGNVWPNLGRMGRLCWLAEKSLEKA